MQKARLFRQIDHQIVREIPIKIDGLIYRMEKMKENTHRYIENENRLIDRLDEQ